MPSPTRTPEGEPNRCPICGKSMVMEPSLAGDAPCPHCGSLVWFLDGGSGGRNPGFPVYEIAAGGTLGTEQAIRAIVERLVADKQLPGAISEELIRRLLHRERLGSTGIGHGVAIPHTIHDGVRKSVGALARFPGGVHFDSIDGKPVHTVLLLVSPCDRPGERIREIERVARYFRSLATTTGNG